MAESMEDLPLNNTQSPVPPSTRFAADGPETAAPLRAGWPRLLVWLPIPVFLVAIAGLWAADLSGSYESPYLLMALNLVFSTLVSGFIAYLVGRSFLIRGTPGLLMLGCGVITWGTAGLVGVAAAGHFDINVLVTIHNVCVWLSALCHLAGAVLSLRPRRAMREASLWLAAAYTVALGCVAVVTLSALAGWTPTFFVQGQGGTPLRYLVLGSATAMFVLTAVLLKRTSPKPLSAFLYWYSLALGLIAVGLFGIMIESVHGGPLSWTGRAGQFLGGAYMLIAAIASVRESHVWGIPLEAALERERTFVSAVLETVGALVAVLDPQGRIVSFNRACEETTGYSFEEVKGKCFWDLMLIPEEVEPVKTIFARLRAGQFPNEHENYWVAKDGTRHLIHWTNSCLADSSGAVEYVIGTGVEVTEQRRAQQEREEAVVALRGSERFQAAVLNSLAAHIAVLDRTGRISAINEPWIRFARENGIADVERIGVGVDYLEASRAAAMAGDPNAAAALDGIEAVLQDRQQQFVIEYPCHSPDEQRWFLMHVTANAEEIGGAIVTHTDITARKRAEAVLRESRAKLQAAFASMMEAIFIGDTEGRLIDFNEEFVRYHRFKDRKECSGTIADCPRYLDAYFQDGTPAPPEMWAMPRALRGETASDVEYMLRRKDTGETWWGSYNFAPIKDEDGRIVGAVVAAREITDRKQAEKSLLESEERMRLALQGGHGGAWEVNLATLESWWSQEMFDLWGVEPGTPLSKETTLRVVHEEDQERVMRTIEDAIARRTVYQAEFRIRHSTRGVRWMAARGQTMCDAVGLPLRLVGITFDITDRQRAEEQVLASEERFRTLTANLSSGVALIDENGKFSLYNPAFLRMFGLAENVSVSNVNDQNWSDWQVFDGNGTLLHVDDHPVRKTAITGEAVRNQLVGVKLPAGGDVKWMLVSAAPATGSHGQRTIICSYHDVTERKRAEETLRKSEQEFRTLAEAMPQIVWATRPDGWNVYFNQQWVDYTGLTLDESYGHGWNTPFHPDDKQRARDAWQRAVEHNETYLLECRLRRADGVYRWWLIHGTPMRSANGEILKWFGTCTDIEEIKQAGEALRKSEERLLLALAATQLGTWDYNPVTGALVWDARCKELFGLPAEVEVNYDMFLAGLHPEDREWANQVVTRTFDPASGGLFDIEYRTVGLRDGGVVRWVRATGQTSFNAAGQAVRFIGTVQDITERKQAEEAVRRSEAKWNAAIEHLGVGAIIATELGEVIYWNPAARVMHGFTSADEGIGPLKETPDTFQLWTPDGNRLLPLEEWPMPRIMHGETVRDVELRLRRPDQGWEKIVSYSGTMVDTASGERLVYLSVYDLTEQRKAEEALAAAKAEAEAANEAKSQFLANMSHELRTPMNAILGMIDVALPKAIDPTVQDCLQTARGSADLLLTLLNDLLDSAKIESGKLELESAPFSLRRMLDQITRVLAVRASEKGLCFCCRMPDETPDAVVGDRMRLQQVLLNLAGNAIKFTERGDVEIGLHALSQDGEACLEFAVRDTGIGIPPSGLERLFQPFAQADASMTRRFGGTGLGLSICKRLVEMMGGHISVESAVGKGSTFCFTVRLPLTKELPPDFEVPVAIPTTAAAQLRILLVEDNPANQKLANYILQDRGHLVEIAGDGQEAVYLTEQNRYDVILMDVQMPGMNGLEATTAIRRREDGKRRVPIIAMTAHAMRGDRDCCLAAGMDGYLSKPLNAQEMIGLVESLARGVVPVPEISAATSGPAKTSLHATAIIFDPEEALTRCFNSEDMVREMIQCFFDEVNSLFPQMRAALEKGDLEEVGRLGHRMKGTVVYLGAQPAKEAALRVERFCKSSGGTPSEAEEAINALEHECIVLKAALSEHPLVAAPKQNDSH